MNIPQSAIEPFGVLGIPTLMYKSASILAALEREVENISARGGTNIRPLINTIKKYHGSEIQTSIINKEWKIKFILPFTSLIFTITMPIK